MYKLIISFVIAIFCVQSVWAGKAEDIANITERLEKLVPQEKPESIKSTAIDGLYEVVFGSDIFYTSADGRYVLQGALLDLDTNENLTETTRTEIRKGLMGKLKPSEMIVFSPKEKPRHTLTVFTDIDCGYCRKLHAEMAELNSYGIEVRYMMFPRSGVNTPSYQKAVNVWCAKDKQISMTKAKAGESLPQANCDNPIAAQFNIGQQLGVTGTPALLLDDGSLIPGYRPAKELAAMLDQQAK
ncbi:MAG: thioredoxin fold domain-containing protein [Gammaproteobacteria bacterium]